MFWVGFAVDENTHVFAGEKNGMYSAHFRASNFYLSNALPNVRIPARTLEFSGAEGEDENPAQQMKKQMRDLGFV